MVLLKVPEPVVVQVTEVALPPIVPASVWVPLLQMVAFPPADTVGAGLIVSTIELETDAQGPTGSLEVMVSVTDPAAISAVEGV